MYQIDLEKILVTQTGNILNGKPKILKHVILKFLRKILYIDTINKFINQHEHLEPRQFINELFDWLNFSYMISDRDIQKIPSEGRLMLVANHPIGSLDGLSLLKAILEIREDVKIISNEILGSIENLKPMLLPFNLDIKNAQRENVLRIEEAIENENAVIIFPAAQVSRLNWFRVVDSKWHKGAAYFSKKYHVPIVPIFINAKNSFWFYLLSILSKRASMLLLVHELFNKRNKTIHIKIGDVIPAKVFSSSYIDDNYQMKLLKKHTYLIGKKKKGIYKTEKNVIHPIDRRLINRELNNSLLIGSIKDNMKIYLTTRSESPQTLNEIARLREVTFRKVGEGTGKKMDIDKYDSIYSHLVIWDEKELEIVGSYRIGLGNNIYQKYGIEGLYTSTLFNYSHEFISEILPNSIELGRSFVQKKYWNTNALNYLWRGIGSYLLNNPSVKYLFGGVSLSDSYPDYAKELIIYFYRKWYSSGLELLSSKRKYFIPEKTIEEFKIIFTSKNIKEDFKVLKNMLKPLGLSVPILYKHYTDLCKENGVKFLDFGTDPDFENCIDGLILIDVDLIKEEKKQKFINTQFLKEYKETA